MCKLLLGHEAKYTLTIAENVQTLTLVKPYLKILVLVGWIKLELKVLSDCEWDLISMSFFQTLWCWC